MKMLLRKVITQPLKTFWVYESDISYTLFFIFINNKINKIMKQFLIALGIVLFVVFASVASANAEEKYQREGNNFVVTQTIHQSTDIQTVYTYTVKDVVYPIWITKNGRCYVVRLSKNGNQYKQYLDKDICLQICKEMNIEYKENTQQ